MCNIDKFDTTIKMLNNELASYTWARLTWAQRAHENKTIIVDIDSKRSWITYYHLPRTVVVCETLFQMQFVSQNEYKIGEAITILNKL